ncbi:DUF4062 domain-containing protein [Tenuibacillus multivorans]|uniref:DUF4062 domain-containing protein n=1 Tax=Tenuibacillus multivorans TaxID=237069 RepID=A0A1H0CGC5_9BACI|nr:DUF4062 domain-containing protein [Tenuibacillus multivorans]GEL76307.1 hypothetical protein TMU01_05420 [Tenuibacillus multivorans]SDN56892.1 protein of unknown function [Tenuibacillus multivorans]
MDKKLQVFVSSTFEDLQDERQAAVSSILNSGHIPAGMELFKAGDESQKETIKKWISESDVFLLILGGRYGSIDEESGKSYTHWEYDHAGELEIPRFAIVIDDDALEEKVKVNGSEVKEFKNHQLYEDFKADVLSKMSKFYSDIKDIKLAILESLKEFERNPDLKGWVSGKEIQDNEQTLTDNNELLKENNKLKEQIYKLENQLEKENEINGYSFEEIYNHLNEIRTELPEQILEELDIEEDKHISLTVLDSFVAYKDKFTVGIHNPVGMSEENRFLFYKVAPELITFGLVDKTKVTGVQWQRLQTTEAGNKFLALYALKQKS